MLFICTQRNNKGDQIYWDGRRKKPLTLDYPWRISFHKQQRLNEKLSNLEILQEQHAKNVQVMFDCEVRILHYVQPHTHKIIGCPVCYEYITKWTENILKAEYTSRDDITGEELKVPNPPKFKIPTKTKTQAK